MKWNLELIKKVQEIFKKRASAIASEVKADNLINFRHSRNSIWQNYFNSLGCPQATINEFYFLGNASVREGAERPGYDGYNLYLHIGGNIVLKVEKSFAEKVLVLGDLP